MKKKNIIPFTFSIISTTSHTNTTSNGNTSAFATATTINTSKIMKKLQQNIIKNSNSKIHFQSKIICR